MTNVILLFVGIQMAVSKSRKMSINDIYIYL